MRRASHARYRPCAATTGSESLNRNGFMNTDMAQAFKTGAGIDPTAMKTGLMGSPRFQCNK